MTNRTPLLASACLLLVLVVATRAEGGADAAARLKALRETFQPLRVPAVAKLAKEAAPSLPPGIVIEAQPFHDLVARLGNPYHAALDEREAALRGLEGAPSPAEANAIRAAWKTVDAECSDLAERVQDVEKAYAEVYNLEYDVSGEKEREARKLAAVLIPLCRGLLAREAGLGDLAAEALGGMGRGEGGGWLAAAAVTDPSPGFRAVAVDALGRVGGAEAGAALRQALGRDSESPVRLRALFALARFKVSEMKDALLQALSDPGFEVRALAVAMCARANLVEAAGALIAALEREDGRLREDIDEALLLLVGVRMYGDAARWKQWWAENEGTVLEKARSLEASGAYEQPLGPVESWDERAAAAQDGKETEGTTAAFYGIPTTSKRVVFVIDISRSMSDAAAARPPATGGGKDPYAEPKGSSKIEIAKWQLHRAIAALPADALFDVIVYSESYKVWQPDMTPATAKAKAKAHAFVDGIVANGTTNIADSLDRAFEVAGVAAVPLRGKTPRTSLAADTIFLLSDGDPNRGRLTSLDALLEDVGRRARAHGIVVHAVGIGEAAGSSFLEALASRTGGRYVGFP